MTSGACALCCLLVLGGGCEKAAPEPPAMGATPRDGHAMGASALPAGSTSGLDAGASAQLTPVQVAEKAAPRCVRALPATPPPAPAYRVDPSCPADPAGGPPMVPAGHVVFPESKDAPTLEVELMLTEARQERGLMYRRSLADDKGMLFAWSLPSVHTFWMHNTCIPLDMLFIDGDGFIAGIVENAPTLNDGPRSIDCPVRYVLEVNAGWSRRHGVMPGQRVQIHGALP